MADARPTISTHVLDTGSGTPRPGVRVRLWRLGDAGPRLVGDAATDDDGRVRDLLASTGAALEAGAYRLELALEGRFFTAVALDLRIDDPARSHHVPLLVAPYGVTTYRGSCAAARDVAGALSIEALDALNPVACAAALAPLFEGAPRFLARLAAARPFRTPERLFAVAREVAHALPEAEQVELIDAHPRLGAPPGSVSPLSFAEQGYGEEAAGAAAEAARARVAAELARLNAAYEARFGFRYCVFVAGRPRAALLPGLEAALGADRAAELARALDAVVDIARDRYRSLAAGT